MKAVFLSVPAHGHINPTLPLVKELVARGETVIYYATSEFRTKIELTGAQFREYQIQMPTDLAALAVNFVKLARFMLETVQTLSYLEEEVAKDEPDYLIYDAISPFAGEPAKLRGKKVIASYPVLVLDNRTVPVSPWIPISLLKMVFTAPTDYWQVRKLLTLYNRKYKVNKTFTNLFSNPGDLNIVFTSRYFQPHSERLDEPTYKFVGPSISPRNEPVSFPWDKLTGKKVIYISLGTVVNRQPEFYRKCFTALGGENGTVILSIGSTPVDELGVIPENFIVQPYVPQLDVLQKTDIFISHGGMNSVNESLFYGVPLIVIPQQMEEFVVGQRVATLGAGVCLPPSVTVTKLRSTVKKVLAKPDYRINARKIGATFIEAGGYQKAAAEILRFVREV